MPLPQGPNGAIKGESGLDRLWPQSIAVAVIGLASINLLAGNAVDPDLWGHLQFGQDLLTTGIIPKAATHAYAPVDFRWINHEIGSQIALALAYKYVGVPGLLIFKCVLGAVIIALVYWRARSNGVNRSVALAWTLLTSATLSRFFLLRPQLFSFLLLSLLLVLLDLDFKSSNYDTVPKRPRIAWLWLSPLLFLAWVNLHGGFAAGLCILGFFLVGHGIRLTYREGTSAWPILVRLVGVLGASLAATVINPYGRHIYDGLENSVGRPRPEIMEWGPLTLSDWSSYTCFGLLAIVVFSLLRSRRTLDWTRVLILACVAWQAMFHVRHFAIFAVLCGFWLPADFQSALSRFRELTATKANALSSSRTRTALLLIGSIMLGGLGSILPHRLVHLPVNGTIYPVDALNFMAENEISGRALVSYNWALYAVSALKPDIEVTFDSRCETCYPQEAIDIHFDFMLGDNPTIRHRSHMSGAIDSTRAITYGNPEIILLDRRYPASTLAMSRHSSMWVLLYQDHVAQVWGAVSEYGDSRNPKFVNPLRRRVYTTKIPTILEWPALPPPSVGVRNLGASVADADSETNQ